jgi:WW domain-binding protein 2
VAAANLDVHLEQLPAYEPAREAERQEEERVILSPIPVRPTAERGSGVPTRNLAETSPREEQAPAPAPDEPPPGYEEAQVQAVEVDLDRRLREEAERR